MKISMPQKDKCLGNGPSKRLWGRIKVVRLHGRQFETRRQAMEDVIDWLMY